MHCIVFPESRQWGFGLCHSFHSRPETFFQTASTVLPKYQGQGSFPALTHSSRHPVVCGYGTPYTPDSNHCGTYGDGSELCRHDHPVQADTVHRSMPVDSRDVLADRSYGSSSHALLYPVDTRDGHLVCCVSDRQFVADSLSSETNSKGHRLQME